MRYYFSTFYMINAFVEILFGNSILHGFMYIFLESYAESIDIIAMSLALKLTELLQLEVEKSQFFFKGKKSLQSFRLCFS